MAAIPLGDTDFLADQPRENWRVPLIEWKGFWFTPKLVKAIIAVQEEFTPKPSDVLIAAFPKTGTTWVKALTVAILNHHSRKSGGSPVPDEDDPLRGRNPHELVPYLEMQCYGDDAFDDISEAPPPRVLNTHMSYSCLSERLRNSGCRVVYISRNPADTFVSAWHFYNQMFESPISLEDDFEAFCRGRQVYGPYFDHVLEYWKERDSDNVLFLTYEELKEDPEKHVGRLADFLGCLMDSKEIGQVVRECSYERLVASSDNIGELHWLGVKYSSFFRKGIVGDWKNVLTPEMLKRLFDVAGRYWVGSGLEFNPADN